MELFRTIHGSKLYGLNHPGSDHDIFIVTTSHTPKAHHYTDHHGHDISVRGLDTFLTHATTGAHQSVEALFSPFKEWTPAGQLWRPMLEMLRIPGTGDVAEKYERTIKKFSYGNTKQRRHAIRLARDLTNLRKTGTTNPHLTTHERALFTEQAHQYKGDALLELLLPHN